MNTILTIISLHWFADFVLQSDKMAQGKSKSNYWLSYHVAVYTLPFLAFFGWQYALLNGAAHWIVDWNTSRVTSRLWQQKRIHAFFTIIGLDQLIHTATLLGTAHWIFHWF